MSENDTVETGDPDTVSENDVADTISGNDALLEAVGSTPRMAGEGTADSPYLITTEAELRAVADGLNKSYRLQNDIALTDAWTPVGTYAASFSGTFDGNGHTISGVTVNSGVEVNKSGTTSYTGYGFFGRNIGTIKNLTISGAVTGGGAYSALVAAYNVRTIENVKVQDGVVTGGSQVGLLAGYNAESAAVSACSVSGKVTGSDLYIGGLVGYNAGKVTGSSADATVSNSNYGSEKGGFAGYNGGSMEDCSSRGTVSSSGSYTGGFVGVNAEGASVADCRADVTVRAGSYTGGFAGSNGGSVENSYASGDVEQSGTDSGGFCGYNTGRLTRCLSEGSVNSTSSEVGGFVGENYGGMIQYAGSRGTVTSSSGNTGGFAGIASNRSTVSNCYATGNVTGSAANVGGFIGSVTDGLSVVYYCYSSGVVSCSYVKGGFAGNNDGNITFLSCYYDKDVTGLADTGKGEPRITAQMKTQDTYVDWSFGGAWGLASEKNDGYPYLLWEDGSGAADPVTPSETLAGEGTEESPYLVRTEADLLAVDRGLDKAYRLEADIALSGSWMPLGTDMESFSGIFDGNGHAISGIVIGGSVEVGTQIVGSSHQGVQGAAFFGRNSGTIRNLRLEGELFSATEYSALAVAFNTGTLDNISVTGVVTETSVVAAPRAGTNGVGLLVGCNTKFGTISGCNVSGAATGYNHETGGLVGHNAGKITDSSADAGVNGGYAVGGFAGYNDNGGSMEGCSSRGTTSSSGEITGGFVGLNTEGALVVGCRADVTVRSLSRRIGGFVGFNGGSVENSRASGDVERMARPSGTSSQDSCGGFCGYNTGKLTRCLSEGSVNNTDNCVGGFVGENNGGMIQYAGSRGTVTSSSGNTGGFAGIANNNSTVSNCYAAGNVTGSGDNVGGFVGRVADQLSVVSNCYSSGVVSCSYVKGGFAGSNDGNITFLSCYYDKDVAGLSDTGKGEPKTTAQMKTQDTYAGWAFGSAWGLAGGKNGGYPYLLWEEQEWVPVAGVSLTPADIALKVGDTQELTVTVTPENATNRSVTWKSSNTAVATVAEGIVTAVKIGTVQITVTTQSGGYTAVCNVTVEAKEPDKPKSYTVKYETNGGGAIADVSVVLGAKLEKPTDLVREGYTFGGWYKDEACTQAWDFAQDTVTADITLYAKWTAEVTADTYTVKYETNGGSAVADANAEAGTKLEKPTDPVREGYTFDGWYKDEACTQAWDFAQDTVTADITLYAKWTAEVTADTYTVKYETNGGSAVADVSAKAGAKLEKPADPAREGYTFDGWYKDEACIQAWDFAQDTVAADMTLYAKWTEKGSGTESEKDAYSVYVKNQRMDLSGCMIAPVKDKVYDGIAYTPKPKVTLTVDGRNKRLVYGTDYRLVYSDNVDAGKGTVAVVGIGNYCGKKTQEFTIDKKNMKKLKAVVSSVATGDAAASPIEVYDGVKRLQKGVDYEYHLTASHVGSKGTARVDVSAVQDSNYTGTLTAKIPVVDTNGKTLIRSSDIALDVTEYRYDGSAHKPNVTVTVNGTVLGRENYSVSYKNNKDAGTAYVLVKGKGASYTGTAVAFFTITPADSANNGFDSVIVNKGRTIIYNGKLQTPSVVVRTNGKKLSAKKDYVLEYSNNLIAGAGYVKITGINNYEGLTTTAAFMINPVTIKKASIKAKSTTNCTLKFKGKTLVEGVDYKVTVGEPGRNGKADVTFTGLQNFNASVTKKKVRQGASR